MTFKSAILAVLGLVLPFTVQAQTVTSFEGIDASSISGPGYDIDPNGAIGTKQYMEWVNTYYQAYDKTSFAPVWASPQAGDTPWRNNNMTNCYGAGGGGVSAVFSRPLFQIGVANVVGSHRGTPDISMTAAVNGAAWVYWSFAGAGAPGWELIGGTSEATPVFSGVVALADQVAGHRLGLINPALYTLGALSQHPGLPAGLVDINAGNNSFNGVTGYNALRGYDLASGWGTIDAAKFVRSLARF